MPVAGCPPKGAADPIPDRAWLRSIHRRTGPPPENSSPDAAGTKRKRQPAKHNLQTKWPQSWLGQELSTPQPSQSTEGGTSSQPDCERYDRDSLPPPWPHFLGSGSLRNLDRGPIAQARALVPPATTPRRRHPGSPRVPKNSRSKEQSASSQQKS